MVQDGVTGVLVDVHDVNQAAAAITQMLGSTPEVMGERLRMGASGQQLAVDYGWDRGVRRVTERLLSFT